MAILANDHEFHSFLINKTFRESRDIGLAIWPLKIRKIRWSGVPVRCVAPRSLQQCSWSLLFDTLSGQLSQASCAPTSSSSMVRYRTPHLAESAPHPFSVLGQTSRVRLPWNWIRWRGLE